MDKKEFKVGDVWLSRNGDKVTILKADLRHPEYPVVGIRENRHGEAPVQYTAAGFYHVTGLVSPHDLVKKYEAPVGPEEMYVYVRVVDGWVAPRNILTKDPGLPLGSAWKVVKYRRVYEE